MQVAPRGKKRIQPKRGVRRKPLFEAGIPMVHDNTNAQKRAWQESGHASLCLLGSYLQEQGFFQPLESRFPRVAQRDKLKQNEKKQATSDAG